MRNCYIHERITALAAELRRLEQRERDEAVDIAGLQQTAGPAASAGVSVVRLA